MLESIPLSRLMVKTYAHLDEASGQTTNQKKTSRTGIVCVAQDDIGRVFVLYAWAGRVRPTDIVQEVIRCHVMYRPKIFGIESNGTQNLFAQLVTEMVHREGLSDFAPYYAKPPMDKTKTERIRNAIQPFMKSGRLFLRETMHDELKREIETFPTGQTNDLVDALAGCIALLPPVFEPQKENASQDAIHTYLKHMGLSDAEINAFPQFVPYPQAWEDPLKKITRSRINSN